MKLRLPKVIYQGREIIEEKHGYYSNSICFGVTKFPTNKLYAETWGVAWLHFIWFEVRIIFMRISK